MPDMDDQPPSVGSAVSDFFGAGAVVRQLVGPIAQGVGAYLQPLLRKRDNRAQVQMFNDWHEALIQKGFDPSGVELTISQRAEVRLLADSIKSQRNREEIAAAAIEHAQVDENPADPRVSAPDMDWLNRFWRIAEHISNDEMQDFFGMVLSRRATCKAAVSARALEFLALLSGEEAKALERIASLTISIDAGEDRSVGVLNFLSGSGKLSSDRRPDGLNQTLPLYVQPLHQELFGPLGIFVESGWAADFHFYGSGPGALPFSIADRQFEVICEDRDLGETQTLRLGSGIRLSSLGREIVQLIKPKADEGYLSLLKEGLEHRGLGLRELSSRSPEQNA